jgi:YD repeat-containing protein
MYRDQVDFYIIYTLEAHPISGRPMEYSYDADGNPIEQPNTYDERVELAETFIDEAEIVMPVLVDGIDNPLWCTYGRRPNMAYLIGMDGRILLQQDWNDPAEMEAAIQDYLAGDI